MLLAAGMGTRMLPLTRDIPKPLLPVKGKPLIEHHLIKLAQANFDEVVINLHYLGELIKARIGDGSRYGLKVHYSLEPVLLETAGGIKKALPMIGDAPFTVISSDIFTDYDFAKLAKIDLKHDAHLMMVDNPGHHREGDFSLDQAGMLGHQGVKLTWSSMGVFDPAFFASVGDGPWPLRDLFDKGIRHGNVSGEHIISSWTDVGTPARYQQLQI